MILLAGVGVAFAFLGASVQPLIAIGLIVAAVVVLALRGISANFAAGVVLQTRHPIKVGDEIEVDDYVGTVRELNGRSVVIITRDGRTVHVPNATLLENLLVNHSELGQRRSDILVRSRAGASQLDEITELVTSSTAAVVGIRSAPPVTVLVQSAEPERLTLLVRFWHDPVAAPAISSPVVRAIADALAAAGVDAVVTSDIPAPPLVPPSEL
ncbi:mechanosensitive ion channel family protein [Microbacterium sp. Leaf161]|uniref:mechanosensitive ion channel family protein n=1 Tax=Microbacterium sp. Leaf161 TaxID=1736281 RepID=UPI00138F7464|nr:mechanosensitive ion channel domain-containing protein [Microbacterium sp. Leaf161]